MSAIPTRSLMIRTLMLGLFLLISFSAASTGYFFPPGEWYASLERPFFAPPNWLFGPVWTVLYILIAIAGWLLWQRQGLWSVAMRWWWAQMLLNALWTPLFFGWNLLGLALVEMALLWLAIAMTIRFGYRVRPLAAWLLAPYLAWVSFAWVLNAGFWWLN
ncbi:MAG: TspO/MBR family protein [Wenzhouxiangella sp.]